MSYFKLGKFPSVRAVDTTGKSRFMRFAQSMDRYVNEPTLKFIELPTADLLIKKTKRQRIQTMGSELAGLLNKLRPLGFIKYTILSNVKKQFSKGTLTRYQLPYVQTEILKNRKLKEVIADEALKPLDQQTLFRIIEENKFTDFNKFRSHILSNYRHKIYEIEKTLKLMNNVWSSLKL